MDPFAALADLTRLFEDTPDLDQAAAMFIEGYPSAVEQVRRVAGLTTVEGAPGFFQTPLDDGTVGYFQRRTDDCLQAAIASLCQISPQLVPDLRLHAQIVAGRDPYDIDKRSDVLMEQWLSVNGLTMKTHTGPARRGRWIGVVVASDDPFNSHCLLMSGRTVLFNPADVLPDVDSHSWSDVTYAIEVG